MNELHKNKDWLRQKYIIEKISMNKISKMCDCDYTTIRIQLTKFGLKKGQEIKCLNCGKKRIYSFDYVKRGKGIFCGLKCQLAHVHKRNKKEDCFLICEVCGKKKKVWPARIKDGIVCCSRECQWKNRRGEKNPAWNGGISREPYGIEFGPRLKEEIRKRDNYTCQFPDCGLVQNGRAFPVHHINYNKKISDKFNLITLCNPHNSQVNINREYWQSYFENLQEERLS